MKKKWCYGLFLLQACVSSPNFWQTDVISTTSRLLYDSPHSSLKLEFLKIGEEISAFLFLDQFRFSPTSDHTTELSFSIDGTIFKESIYLRQGRMRLKLSSELMSRLILALQDGKQVTMMTSELVETIEAASFEISYAKFLKGSEPLNFIKGPFE